MFKQFNLSASTLAALEKMGIFDPTAIQQKVIPLALAGKNIIGQSQTGTGKTAAFAIPIVENVDLSIDKIQHLILSPTRELATQIYNVFLDLSFFNPEINVALVVGGVDIVKQKRLMKNAHIVVATPGRLEDICSSGKIDFSHLKSLCLDEADELLKVGFYEEIIKITKRLPLQRQNYFFTATFDKKTKNLSQQIMKDEIIVEVSQELATSNNISQKFLIVKEKNKLQTLVKILDLYKPYASVVFGRTKKRVEELSEALQQLGFKARGIQGDMAQKDRNNIVKRFRDKEFDILVATDVMARGIDVPHIDWVFNFDLPQEIEYYVHRIGRTGRSKRQGSALSFVKPEELFHLESIQNKTKATIKEIQIPSKEELRNIWEAHLFEKLTNILEESKNKQKGYISQSLVERYNQEELAILLAQYIVDSKTVQKDIKLTPEPAILPKLKKRPFHRERRKNK